jgi:hypothetical protein
MAWKVVANGASRQARSARGQRNGAVGDGLNVDPNLRGISLHLVHLLAPRSEGLHTSPANASGEADPHPDTNRRHRGYANS